MPEEYYQRIVRTSVTVLETGQTRAWLSYDPVTRNQGLRQAFRAEKTKSSEPNKGEVQLWALSDDSIALLSAKGAVVSVEAGYESLQNLGLLFIGDVDHVDVKNKVTKVEAGDGSRKYRLSRVATSYATPVSLQQLLQLFAGRLGLPLRLSASVRDIRLTQGGAFVGRVSDQLDSVTKSLGLTWSIQDNVLQVVEEGSDTGQRAVVLGPQTGLIGEPSKNVKEKTVQFKALLQPKLVPNRLVNLKPRALRLADFEGFYRAVKVVHQGDSGFDTPFYTDIEAKKL